MDLELIKKRIFDNINEEHYQKIKRKKLNKKFLLTIIIPVRGRVEFLLPTITHLKKSILKYSNKINIIVVEESKFPQHKEVSKNNNVDYYFIESSDIHFNKSLCNNVGALLYKNSDYFLFHDIDCLVKEDFIANIFQNLKIKNLNCLQTFNKRRVLYYSELQTEKILNNELTIYDIDDKDLKEGDCCAPGGSILVKNTIFFSVGGYDPELFYGWSPEDQFFWDKVEFLDVIGSCDTPQNEIYHMHHFPQNLNKEQMPNSEEKYDFYNAIKKESIGDIIKIKKEILNKYL